MTANNEKLALINSLINDKDVWTEIDQDYVLVDSTDAKVRALFEQLGVDIDEYYREHGSFMDAKDTSMCIVALANQFGAIGWWQGRGFMDYVYSEDDDTITIDAERFRKLERIAAAGRHWRETRTGGEWTIHGNGSSDALAILQTMMAREQALITAVDALNKSEGGAANE